MNCSRAQEREVMKTRARVVLSFGVVCLIYSLDRRVVFSLVCV